MTRSILRIALAASWAGRASERRRAGLLAIAGAVVVVMSLGCLSAVLRSTRIDERATGRSFRVATDHEAAVLERSGLYDETARGDQIYVYWWRILDDTVAIPGVGADPSEGSWFISPELARLGESDPSLARRYPNARLIGNEGVAHPGELLAYRFVGPGIVLDERLSGERSEDWIGDGAEVVETYPIAVATLALIGIPGLGLIIAAMAPLSGPLVARQAILHAMGAPQKVRRAVVAVQVGASALPGVMFGALGWWLISPHLTAVPLVGRRVFPGDLAVPALSVWAVAVGVLVLVVVVALARPRRRRGNRPTSAVPERPSPARVVPVVCGAAVMALGVAVPGRPGAKLFLAGVLAATVGTVVALPLILDRVGTRLAMMHSTVGLLVGRRLRSSAVAQTRSLLAVGTLAALLPLVGAWVAVARTVDRPTPSNRYVVELRGGLSAEEVARLRAEVHAETLQVAAQPSGGGPQSIVLAGDCSALEALVSFDRCDRGGFTFAQGQLPGGLDAVAGTATAPAGTEIVSTLFFSADSRAMESELRAHVVNADHTGMSVSTPGRAVFHESPLVHWILGAAALAGLVGGLALVLHLAGQAARSAPTRLRLMALGCDTRFVQRVAAAEAALSVGAVGISCAGVGCVSSWLFVRRDGTAEMPSLVIGLVALGVLAAAGLAGLAAASAVRHPAGGLAAPSGRWSTAVSPADH